MLTRIRPSSHRYQVATLCGAPFGFSVEIVAGFGSRSRASSSAGSGGFGMPAVLSAGVAGGVLRPPRLRLEAQQHRRPRGVLLDQEAAVLPDAVVTAVLADVALVLVDV